MAATPKNLKKRQKQAEESGETSSRETQPPAKKRKIERAEERGAAFISDASTESSSQPPAQDATSPGENVTCTESTTSSEAESSDDEIEEVERFPLTKGLRVAYRQGRVFEHLLGLTPEWGSRYLTCLRAEKAAGSGLTEKDDYFVYRTVMDDIAGRHLEAMRLERKQEASQKASQKQPVDAAEAPTITEKKNDEHALLKAIPDVTFYGLLVGTVPVVIAGTLLEYAMKTGNFAIRVRIWEPAMDVAKFMGVTVAFPFIIVGLGIYEVGKEAASRVKQVLPTAGKKRKAGEMEEEEMEDPNSGLPVPRPQNPSLLQRFGYAIKDSVAPVNFKNMGFETRADWDRHWREVRELAVAEMDNARFAQQFLAQQQTGVIAQQQSASILRDTHPCHFHRRKSTLKQPAAGTAPFGTTVSMKNDRGDQQNWINDCNQIQAFLSEANDRRLSIFDVKLEMSKFAEKIPGLHHVYTEDPEYHRLLQTKYAYKLSMRRSMKAAWKIEMRLGDVRPRLLDQFMQAAFPDPIEREWEWTWFNRFIPLF